MPTSPRPSASTQRSRRSTSTTGWNRELYELDTLIPWSRFLSGDSPLVSVEYEPTVRTQSDPSGPHASDDSADVGNFFRAKPEDVGGAGGPLRGRLGGARCRRRHHANGNSEGVTEPTHVGAWSDASGAQNQSPSLCGSPLWTSVVDRHGVIRTGAGQWSSRRDDVASPGGRACR